MIEPAGQNAIAAAVQWVQAILLGSTASAIAVVAIASVGFLLLTGRVDMRRAAQVLFGCFIVFGASSLAAGIMRAVQVDAGAAITAAAPSPPPPVYPASAAQAAQPPATPYDPYAGAAMPTR